MSKKRAPSSPARAFGRLAPWPLAAPPRSGARRRQTRRPRGGRDPVRPRGRTRLDPVCGICGIVSSKGRIDRKRLAAMSATIIPAADRTRRGHVREGRCRTRGAAGSRSSTSGRRPADLERGRELGTVVQNGEEIYNFARAEPASSSGRAEPVPHRSDTEDDRPCVLIMKNGEASASPSIAAGCSRSRSGMRSRGGDSCSRADQFRSGSKPLYYRDLDRQGSFAPSSTRSPGASSISMRSKPSSQRTRCRHALSIFRPEARRRSPGHVARVGGGPASVYLNDLRGRDRCRSGPTTRPSSSEECRARLLTRSGGHISSRTCPVRGAALGEVSTRGS